MDRELMNLVLRAICIVLALPKATPRKTPRRAKILPEVRT